MWGKIGERIRSRSPKGQERVTGRQSPPTRQSSNSPTMMVQHQNSMPTVFTQQNISQTHLPTRGTFPQPTPTQYKAPQPEFKTHQEAMLFKADSKTLAGVNIGKAFFDHTIKMDELARKPASEWPYPQGKDKIDVLLQMHQTRNILESVGRQDPRAIQGLEIHHRELERSTRQQLVPYSHQAMEGRLNQVINDEIKGMIDKGQVTSTQAKDLLKAGGLAPQDRTQFPIELTPENQQALVNIVNQPMHRPYTENMKELQEGAKLLGGVRRAEDGRGGLHQVESEANRKINTALVGMIERHEELGKVLAPNFFHEVRNAFQEQGLDIEKPGVLNYTVLEKFQKMEDNFKPSRSTSSGNASPVQTSPVQDDYQLFIAQATVREANSSRQSPVYASQQQPLGFPTHHQPIQNSEPVPSDFVSEMTVPYISQPVTEQPSADKQTQVPRLPLQWQTASSPQFSAQPSSVDVTHSPVDVPKSLSHSYVQADVSIQKPIIPFNSFDQIMVKPDIGQFESLNIEKSYQNLSGKLAEFMALPADKQPWSPTTPKLTSLNNMKTTLTELYEDADKTKLGDLASWSYQALQTQLDGLIKKEEQNPTPAPVKTGYQKPQVIEQSMPYTTAFGQGPMEHIPAVVPDDGHFEENSRVSEGSKPQLQIPEQHRALFSALTQPQNPRDAWKGLEGLERK